MTMQEGPMIRLQKRGPLLLVFGLLACEGEERPYQYVAPLAARDAGSATASQSAAAASDDPAAVSPTDTRGEEQAADPAIQVGGQETSASCEPGTTQPCGPSTDQGSCEFGVRSCTSSGWGGCVGAVLPGERQCGSTDDNDCDGQPDNVVDEVCRCVPGTKEPCDSHPVSTGEVRVTPESARASRATGIAPVTGALAQMLLALRRSTRAR